MRNSIQLLNSSLYLIQDSDRPMYVLAESYQEAYDKWACFVADENQITVENVGQDPPLGIQFIADSNDILI